MNNKLKRAKIIFDLHGYYIIKNVFQKDQIKPIINLLNKQEFHERKLKLRNSKESSSNALTGNNQTGRFDLSHTDKGPLLSIPFFSSVLNQEKLFPYLELFLGRGYRLDHVPLVIKQVAGSEGFSLHGGPGRELWYKHLPKTGEVLTSLIGCSVALTDQNKEDGGFCVVKGSHKMNFDLTREMTLLEDEAFVKQNLDQVDMKTGDVLLFSEATVHGCLAWNNEKKTRYSALYRFAPANYAFARGYTEEGPAIYSVQENPVVQPPYSTFYDRLDRDGKLISPRTQTKKSFDEKVFQQKVSSLAKIKISICNQVNL
eukprot:snap_masked-scaffold_3-processed-gene-11.21-mRNA-1 protein AED:0.04 eAED:0.05 QI:0/0/0/0.5/1/1/2/0/313